MRKYNAAGGRDLRPGGIALPRESNRQNWAATHHLLMTLCPI